MPRGSSKGVTDTIRNSEVSITQEELGAKAAVSLGGRAAEEVVFGKDNVTSAASKDLQKASRIANLVVTKFGMNEKVGNISVDTKRDIFRPEVVSEETLAALDREQTEFLEV